jgi:hypothetical protein
VTEPESDKDTSNDVDMTILDKVLVVKGKQPKSGALAPVTVNERKLRIIDSRDMLILTCMKGGGKNRKAILEQTRAAGKPSKPLILSRNQP